MGRLHVMIQSDKYLTEFQFQGLEKKVLFSAAGFYRGFRDTSGRPEIFGGVGETHTPKLTLRRNEQERSVMRPARAVFFSMFTENGKHQCILIMEGIEHYA